MRKAAHHQVLGKIGSFKRAEMSSCACVFQPRPESTELDGQKHSRNHPFSALQLVGRRPNEELQVQWQVQPITYFQMNLEGRKLGFPETPLPWSLKDESMSPSPQLCTSMMTVQDLTPKRKTVDQQLRSKPLIPLVLKEGL